MRKRLRNVGLFSLEKRHREDFYHHVSVFKRQLKRRQTHFFTRTRGKVKASYSQGDFNLTQVKFFTMRKISHQNILPKEVMDSWVGLLKFAWARCWAILSTLQFCQESLDQMFLCVPSNLVFYYSVNELHMCMEKIQNIFFHDNSKSYC